MRTLNRSNVPTPNLLPNNQITLVHPKVSLHCEGTGSRGPGAGGGTGEAVGMKLCWNEGDRGKTGPLDGVDRVVSSTAIKCALEVDSGLKLRGWWRSGGCGWGRGCTGCSWRRRGRGRGDLTRDGRGSWGGEGDAGV